jgi:TonB family protein
VAKRTALAKKTAASTAQATAGCVAALIRLGIFLAIVYYGGRWLLTVPEIASLKDALVQGEVSDDTVRTAFDGLRRRVERIFGDPSETSAIPSLTTETTRDVVRPPVESPVPFGPDDTPPPGVYLPGNGVTMPRILRQASPAYTASARRARIEGPIILRAIVETDGTVSNIEVVQSLDRTSGLDAAALVALRQWRFAPGEREGQPVRVLIRVTMNFALSPATADNR